MINIKSRETRFCNIKVLLIFLVVYGHLIESRIDESTVLMITYKIIYFIHMPLFVFLSGYFINSKEMCIRQAVKTLKLYLILQVSLYVMVNYLNIHILGIDVKTLARPYWHFWYLLSLGWWCLIGYGILYLKEKKGFYNRKGAWLITIIVAVAIACLAGCDGRIERELSLSRTIVFAPYFLMGLFVPKDIQWNRLRKISPVIAVVLTVLLFLTINRIPYYFLWQANSYGGNISEGIVNRLICFVIAIAAGFLIITYMPDRRFGISKVGTDTLKIYICHGFVVLSLKSLKDLNINTFIYLSAGIAGVIIFLIYKVFMWSGQLYSLTNRVKTGFTRGNDNGEIQGNIR